jgi:hypothetical protein
MEKMFHVKQFTADAGLRMFHVKQSAAGSKRDPRGVGKIVSRETIWSMGFRRRLFHVKQFSKRGVATICP